MVASMVILVAFITRLNINSQKVQVLGFIRLGRSPRTRNGIDSGPRRATGMCKFCQHPLQISDCGWAIRLSGFRRGQFLERGSRSRHQVVAGRVTERLLASNAGSTCETPSESNWLPG